MALLHGQYDLGVESIVDDSGRTTISLSSDDIDPEELQVNEVYGELVQKSKLKGIARKYSIVNMYYLLIQERTRSSQREYWVNLGYLAARPGRRLNLAWGWLAIVLLIALSTLAVYRYLPYLDLRNQTSILSGIFIACSLAASVSLYFFFQRSRYCHVYLSRTARQPLVELIPARPDRRKYRQFMRLLQEHIQLAGNKGVNPGNALAKELREHRRLCECGILSDGQYARAKERILSGHSPMTRR